MSSEFGVRYIFMDGVPTLWVMHLNIGLLRQGAGIGPKRLACIPTCRHQQTQDLKNRYVVFNLTIRR
jgi:hypothetical protein